jgi:phage/plasmid-like protein (TIGR03299 family)
MSHEILENDHMVSANGIVPWHKLGTVVEGALTAEAALTQAKLGWSVTKKRIRVADGKSFPHHFGIVREDTGEPLGIVGTRYTPIQNVDGLNILDPVIGDDAVYETAGSLRNGRIVWFLASLKKEYFLSGKNDGLKQYFLVYLSHDGTKPVSVRFVSTRVVCMNTLSCALGEAKSMVVIRHTKNYKDRIDEAHRIVGLADKHAQEFQRVYSQLQSIKMNETDAKKFIEVWMPGDGKRVGNTRTKVFELFKGERTGGIATEGRTRADALNAVTQFLSHEKPVRAKRAAESRFETNMLGYGIGMQKAAVDLLLN